MVCALPSTPRQGGKKGKDKGKRKGNKSWSKDAGKKGGKSLRSAGKDAGKKGRGPTVCQNCGKAGHFARECWKGEEAEGREDFTLVSNRSEHDCVNESFCPHHLYKAGVRRVRLVTPTGLATREIFDLTLTQDVSKTIRAKLKRNKVMSGSWPSRSWKMQAPQVMRQTFRLS